MPETTYRTRDGDMIDLIAYRNYGNRPSAVVAILERNRDIRLSERAPLLPAGLQIVLPDVAAVPPEPTPDPGAAFVLWD